MFEKRFSSLSTMCFGLALALAVGFLGFSSAGCGPKNKGSSGVDGGGEIDAGCGVENQCGAQCCTNEEHCHNEQCLTVIGDCSQGQGCVEDSRCIDGHCIPWSEFPDFNHDIDCVREVEPGVLRPQIQCAWEADPDVDPEAGFHAVRHTPLVVDFGLGDIDVSRGPSIVVIGREEYGGGALCPSRGPIVVLDGRTCEELYRTESVNDGVRVTVTPAAADLDEDGWPEVIGAGHDGGLRAFTYDPGTDAFVLLWRSTDENGDPSVLGGAVCQWGGVTVADLDGGAPEVFFAGAAHGPDGQIIGRIPGYQHFSHGNPMVVLDVDLDGEPEVVEGYGTYEYTAGVGFELISGWVGSGGPGFIAVADLGEFPTAAGDGAQRPEVVVVSQDVRVQTILGEVVFSAGGGYGHGGPPTIADFDQDGRAEIGVAFGDGYFVYDLDCVGAPAGCAGEGLLWSQPSQDVSSARTGSSVFDFNGDGRPEVVYGDECFVRVYDGANGKVVFSQGRFSSTWQENVVIADVDGDSSAEVVLPASSVCNPQHCDEWDESFLGLPCESAADCPGGDCVENLCRCQSALDCGETFDCATPLPQTPGTGNVCRTRHKGCLPGIRVYRDARDRWAGSRRIWNQHAYYVTNVAETGVVPSRDTVLNNWQQNALNNFRQNVQGEVGPLDSADLTVKGLTVDGCSTGQATLSAEVCNRGAAGTDAGVLVSFWDMSDGDLLLCEAVTDVFLDVGQCVPVSCQAEISAGNTIRASVNGNESVGECRPDNNDSLPLSAVCAQ